MSGDDATSRGDSGELQAKLQSALQKAESAWRDYGADPSQQCLVDVIEAWNAVADPTLAGLLTAVRRAWVTANVGAAWWESYVRDGRRADLEQAIRHYEDACTVAEHIDNRPDGAAGSDRIRLACLAGLARCLRARALENKSTESSDRAVVLLEQAFTLTPAESDGRRETARLLAMVLQERYDLGREVDDLRRAAGLLRQVRDHPLERDGIGAGVELAACLLELDSAGCEGLDEAIAVLESARPDPDGATDATVAAERCYAMGVALAIRFERNGSSEDASRELEAFGEAVALGGDGPEVKYRDGLGGAFQDRWRVTGEASWLDRALGEYEQALAGCPGPHDELRIRRNIGNTLASRFRHSGHDQDLRAALDHLRAAATGMPDDPRFVLSFAAVLLDANQAGGAEEDLAEALLLLDHVREEFPAGSADCRAMQTNLGNALRARFARGGDLNDLDRALSYHRAAVDGLCDSAPDAAIYLTMYGHALRERYAQTGDPRDLEASGLAYSRASAAALGSEQDAVHAAKGTTSLDAYRRTGDPAELQAAIGFYARAAQLCPPASPALAAHLSDLGTAYRLRYLHTGQLRDLERALASLDDAIARTPAPSPDRSAFLAARGVLRLDSFNRTGSVGAVDEAVADLVEAVDATPVRAPRRADYQATLAAALILRHELAALTSDIQAQQADLDNAVALLESALTLVSAQAIVQPEYLDMLGNALLARYRRDERQPDLDQAVELLEQALRSAGATGRAGVAENLARACRLRWSVGHRDDDLRRGTQMYDEACQPGQAQGPGQMVEVAQEWGRWALDRESWPEAARAYRRCLEYITVLSASHAARHHKDAWLEPAAEVPSRVAYAYARAGDPATAAALFERGRCFLLNETAEWRRTLQEGHPALHARLRDALSAADAMAAAAKVHRQGTAAPYLPVTQFERTYTELDQVLAEIAVVTEGNAGRLDLAGERPERLEDAWLVQLAPGPRSGVALISPPDDGTIEVVLLAEASETGLREQLSIVRSAYGQRRAAPLAWLAVLDEVTGWLGRNIGQHLISMLPQDADVVLVGGGALGLLPLHAAWMPVPSGQDRRRYLLDHVRIRHAPNIASVRQGSHAARIADADKILLIDDPRPETTPIRAARLGQAFLSQYFQGCVTVSGADATRSAVLHAITGTGCGVVHFSCHGAANTAEPMESAFLLADGGTLTVRDLFGAAAPPIRLGVLAGCETGVAGSQLPDEVLGLATALLAASVIGVVASAWAIPDKLVTAALLARFYELWRTGADPPAEALRQAQRWTRDSTNQQKTALYPWYGEAYPGRIGGAAHRMWLSARAHAHPYWWAGFTYTGA